MSSPLRVLFHTLHETGHLNPTYPIARALANRGHDVIYASVLELAGAIEARGFRCERWYRDAIPRGLLAAIDRMYVDDDRNSAQLVIRDRIDEELFSGRIEDAVRAIDPDVIAADIIAVAPIRFVAHHLGIPCLQISTSLSQRHDELPPITCDLEPAGRVLELAAQRWMSSSVNVTAGEVHLAPTIAAHAEQYCARFGYPPSRISFASTFTYAFAADRELVLAASALDYPRTRPGGPIYLASPVELDRAEHVPDPLRAFVDPGRPLIYASLGSQSGRYRHAARFFRSVIAALGARPDWHAVVACGARLIDDPMFADRPANLLVLHAAPQIWMLRRASVFVTHAGLGSVREAVALHVPVVAVPQQYDQIGNAARVVHHGLGLALEPDTITPASLVAAIEHVSSHAAAYRERSARIDDACRREESQGRQGVDVLESAARERRPRPAVPVCEVREVTAAQTQGVVAGWMFTGLAGFIALRPGATLRTPADQPIGIGESGFTISRELDSALMRGTGPVLVRGELSGRLADDGAIVAGDRLRCRWRLDLSEVLHDHARSCAERAFALEPPGSAMLDAVRELLERHDQLRRSGASLEAITSSYRNVFSALVPWWHRPLRLAAAVASPSAFHGARWAHRAAAQSVARHEVGDAIGTAEGAAIYVARFRAIRHDLAIALDSRVRAHIERAGFEVKP